MRISFQARCSLAFLYEHGAVGKDKKEFCKQNYRFCLCESNLAAPVGSLNVFLSHQQWERRIECDVFVLVKGITRSWRETKCFALFLLQFSTEK